MAYHRLLEGIVPLAVPAPDAMEIVRMRLAKGEITPDDFDLLRQKLQS